MFSNLTLDDLELTFDQESFGPQGKTMDFSDQFDGKLFKPYNKLDKMGKFCEFSTTQAAPVFNKQSQITQKQAQAAAVDSLFVEEKDDQGFENVEEKVRGKQD
jgi:hypothetical protein